MGFFTASQRKKKKMKSNTLREKKMQVKLSYILSTGHVQEKDSVFYGSNSLILLDEAN